MAATVDRNCAGSPDAGRRVVPAAGRAARTPGTLAAARPGVGRRGGVPPRREL